MSRLEQLESKLNRVNLQQDALLPLLQMIEYIPAIQKSDSTVRSVIKKEEVNEAKASRLERCLERKSREVVVPQQIITIEEVEAKISDLEQNINSLYRWYEAKLKEGSQQIARNLDEKFNIDQNAEFHTHLLQVVEETMRNSVYQMMMDFQQQISQIKSL